MNDMITFLEQYWSALLMPLSVTVLTLVVGLFVRRSSLRLLGRWAAGTAWKFDDIVVAAIRGPLIIWIFMLALHLGVQTSNLPPRAQALAAQVLLVLFEISITLAVSRLAGALVKFYFASLTTLAENLTRIVILLLGATVILDTLRISVLPILTAFGVGGIAIALALQDTLSNLFSGFYVSLAGQVRVGDYIRLDSGDEGYISDITWRSTSVRSLQNNVIIIPNAKLAKSTITNYDLPEQSMAVSVAVSVSYDCDPQAVEDLLIAEVKKLAGLVPGLLAEPAPFVRFAPGFGPYSLDFTLYCYVRKFADQFLVQHEIRKRVFSRLREERIEIPFPTRSVYMHNAPAEAEQSRSAATS
jgi:small-conductance mechanosensitive channel